MRVLPCLFLLSILYVMITVECADSSEDLDLKVKAFLDEQQHKWRDMNVPYADGKLLYDLILKNGYTRALEIGTSTGHSSIWMAWALSKTGGELVTIEINKGRRDEALRNFDKVGLSDYIDSRFGDAHAMVKELEGPFDFVFSDADKDWYKQYFIDIYPKLETGGCFTAHNVRNPYGGIQEFLDYVTNHSQMETTIDKTTRAGISISYKK